MFPTFGLYKRDIVATAEILIHVLDLKLFTAKNSNWITKRKASYGELPRNSIRSVEDPVISTTQYTFSEKFVDFYTDHKTIS